MTRQSERYIQRTKNKKTYYFTSKQHSDLYDKLYVTATGLIPDEIEVKYFLEYCDMCLNHETNLLEKCRPELGRILSKATYT